MGDVSWVAGAPGRPALDARSIGILAFVAALVFGSLHGGLSKWLTEDLSVPVILWWRYLGLFLIVVPVALIRHGRGAVVPARRWLHVLRALLIIVSSLTFLGAISGVPLADTMAIVFVYPFVVTALAPLILGEKIGLPTWIAVAAGFLGVLVVMRPGFSTVDAYALLALATGATFAFVLLITRKLAVASPPTVTATWTAGLGLIVLSFWLPFAWVAPSLEQLLVLVVMSAFAAASQLLTMFAFSKADAPALAPFGYSEIVTATAVGFVLFGDFPDLGTWSGIVIIVTSGIYLAFAGRPLALPLVSRSRTPGT